MPRDVSRDEMLNFLAPSMVLDGMTVPGVAALIGQPHDLMRALGEQAQQAARLAKVMARVQFHLGLVRLLEDFPEVESIGIGEQLAIEKGNLAKVVSIEFNDRLDDLAMRERTRSEKRLDTMRHALPFNSLDKGEVVALFKPFYGSETFHLTRANVPKYLKIVLGEDLFPIWLSAYEQTSLRAELGNGEALVSTNKDRARL